LAELFSIQKKEIYTHFLHRYLPFRFLFFIFWVVLFVLLRSLEAKLGRPCSKYSKILFIMCLSILICIQTRMKPFNFLKNGHNHCSLPTVQCEINVRIFRPEILVFGKEIDVEKVQKSVDGQQISSCTKQINSMK